MAEIRIAELGRRLAELSAMRDSLERFVASWRMPPAEAGPPRRSGMRTGQVARQAGVSIKTLRYYEQHGVMRARQDLDRGSFIGVLRENLMVLSISPD